jgi:hypothetical protein
MRAVILLGAAEALKCIGNEITKTGSGLSIVLPDPKRVSPLVEQDRTHDGS